MLPAVIAGQVGIGLANIKGGTGHWSYVMFFDASRFMSDFCDGRQRVWRRRGERYFDSTNLPHDRYVGGCYGGSLWGGVTTNERTDLHVCQSSVTGVYYRNNIIEPLDVPLQLPMGIVFASNMTMPVHIVLMLC